QECSAVEGPVRHADKIGELRQRLGWTGTPARNAHAPDGGFRCHGISCDPADDINRQGSRMVGPFDEGKTRDDLWGGIKFKRTPPGTRRCNIESRYETKIAFRLRHCGNHPGGAHVWNERNRKAEMKARGIAYEGIAGRQISVNGERRLHIRKS